MMTQRTGRFMGAMSVSIDSNHNEEDPEFRIRPYMFLADDGLRGTISGTPLEAPFSVGLYQMKYEVMIRFAVNLTSPGTVELTELTQTRHFNEWVARLAKEVPDKTQLPAYLADVMRDLEAELPDKLISIGTESLRAIGEQVQDSQTARLLTTEVLAGIFGERMVVLQGKIYDVKGNEQDSRLNGKLLTVLESSPSGTLVGPVFVVLQGNELRYAPVVDVTDLQI
jgi:hypothetical protein